MYEKPDYKAEKKYEPINCLECDGEIEISNDTELSELISCPSCGIEFEVVNLEPVKLQLAPKDEDDWGE